MNEKYLKLSQEKNQLEKQIHNMYNGVLPADKNADYNDEYNKLKQSSADIRQRIQGIISDIDGVENILSGQTIENHQSWKRKVSLLKQSTLGLTAFLEQAYNYQVDKIRKKRDENSLFAGANKKQYDTQNQGISMMVEDNDTISRINRTGASAIERGHEVLGSLARQQERMGLITGRMAEIVSDLGISSDFLRVIQRRSRNDCYLLIGLAIFTFLFIITLTIYMR